ncbi:MAG TPA: hypothetical protein VJN70_08965 [Gemmatimonadaceae bacterium]|nr:hypothetical protein [Gemmatimonadaceae bacterium]
MSLPRFITGVVTAALLVAVLPFAAHAQAPRRTACNDGSTTGSVSSNACDGHGGINKARTTVLNRAPARHTETGHVAQAGTPAPSAKPRYEERRGWRWGRRDDHKRDEERRREDERRREEERRHGRVKCRDGRFENAKEKGHAVCKNHGGLAH